MRWRCASKSNEIQALDVNLGLFATKALAANQFPSCNCVRSMPSSPKSKRHLADTEKKLIDFSISSSSSMPSCAWPDVWQGRYTPVGCAINDHLIRSETRRFQPFFRASFGCRINAKSATPYFYDGMSFRCVISTRLGCDSCDI